MFKKFVFIKALLAAITLLSFSLPISASESAPSRIIDASWIQKNIDNPFVRLIDLRTAEEFASGHIKNSVHIYHMNLFGEGYKIPPMNEIRELFSNAGIDHNIRVVAIDDGSFIWSARLVWLLETLGHKNVHMLNVGYGNWQNNNIQTSTEAVYPQRRNFVTSLDNNLLQTKLGTLMAIGKTPIIDGRSDPHYLGIESMAKRYGHIPTAENSSCTKNIKQTASGNQLHKLEDLVGLYQHLPKDQLITLYCDGGAEAALNYVVMKELGYKVAVYDGSWVEWGNDESLPIENPSQQQSQ